MATINDKLIQYKAAVRELTDKGIGLGKVSETSWMPYIGELNDLNNTLYEIYKSEYALTASDLENFIIDTDGIISVPQMLKNLIEVDKILTQDYNTVKTAASKKYTDFIKIVKDLITTIENSIEWRNKKNNFYDITLPESVIRLDIPTPVLDSVGKTVTWNDDLLASSYSTWYSINGIDTPFMINEPELNAGVWTQKLDEILNSGTYTIKVQANTTTTGYGDSLIAVVSGYTVVATVPQLDTPTNLTIVGTTLTWDTVPNAGEYIVSTQLDTSGSPEVINDGITTTEFELSTLTDVGTYTIKVYAVAEGYAISEAAIETYEVELVLPNFPETNTEVTSTGVTWDAVPGADEYLITWEFDNGLLMFSANEYRTTNLEFVFADHITEPGDYIIKIFAVANDELITSPFITTYTVSENKLDTPNLILDSEGKKITWAKIDDAEAYNISYIFNNVTSSFNVELIEKPLAYELDISELTEPGEYTIEVQATTTNVEIVDSDIATTTYLVVIPKLNTPVITIIGDTASWEKIDNADSYAVRYKDEDGTYYNFVANPTYDDSTYSISLEEIDEAGTYTILVVAVGDGINYLDSDEASSEPYPVVTIPVVSKLDNPVLVMNQTDKELTWAKVEDAEEYTIFWCKDISPEETPMVAQPVELDDTITLDLTELDIQGPGSYTILVQAITSDETIEDSDEIESDPYIVPAIQLGTPTGLIIADNVISWNKVTNATGYAASAVDQDNEWIDISDAIEIKSDNIELDIDALDIPLNPGIYKIAVVATKVDDDDYRASDPAETVFLLFPIQPRIGEVKIEDLTLTFDSVEYIADWDVTAYEPDDIQLETPIQLVANTADGEITVDLSSLTEVGDWTIIIVGYGDDAALGITSTNCATNTKTITYTVE